MRDRPGEARGGLTRFMGLVLVAVCGSGVAAGAEPQAEPSRAPAGRFEVAGIEDDAAVASVLHGLQAAVAKNDRAAVAAMVRYPITVVIAGKTVVVRGRGDLVEHYDGIFNAKVRKSLASQKLDDLFASWRGLMIGNGEIWLNRAAGSDAIEITAINTGG